MRLTRNGESPPVSDDAVFCVLVLANLLNFLDRGIVPGAAEEFAAFISQSQSQSLSLSAMPVDALLGLLQSAFIAGLVCGSLLFGHLMTRAAEPLRDSESETDRYNRDRDRDRDSDAESKYNRDREEERDSDNDRDRFSLTCLGLAVWSVAAICAGLSGLWQVRGQGSYWFLLVARMLSGFGEASLQCTIPPWIQTHAPPSKQGTWLAIFFTAIPVGTALGYAFSAVISRSLGWPWAFLLEAVMMSPCLAFLYYIQVGKDRHSFSLASTEEKRPINDIKLSTKRTSLGAEICNLLAYRVFVCLIFASAAQTAVLIGLSTFGSAFMISLGFFNSETEASSTFGLLISVAGVIATPLGGWALDKTVDKFRSHSAAESDDQLISVSCTQIYWATYVGTLLLSFLFFVHSRFLYLFLVTCGCAFIFFTNTGLNMAIMLSVPKSTRSLGIAVGTVCGHAFGDVPSPIIAGWMKDLFAPNCVPHGGDTGNTDNASASPECRSSSDGIRVTMLMISLWMFWAVFLYALAWYYQSKEQDDKRRKNVSDAPQ